jgi:hypothetical protein
MKVLPDLISSEIIKVAVQGDTLNNGYKLMILVQKKLAREVITKADLDLAAGGCD